MAITNAQQYQQLVRKDANGKRPGYRGDAAYRSRSAQSSTKAGGQGNVGTQASFGGSDRDSRQSTVYGPTRPSDNAPTKKSIDKAKKFQEEQKQKREEAEKKRKQQEILNFFDPRPKAYKLASLIPGAEKNLGSQRRKYKKYLKYRGAPIPDFLEDEENLTSYDTYKDLLSYKPTEYTRGVGDEAVLMPAPDTYEDYLYKKGNPTLKMKGNVGGLRFEPSTGEYVRTGDGGQDQPIIPVVPTTTGIASATTGTTAASDTSDLDDYIAQMREGAAYRFFADGGRVPAQQGGIMPRLNELSGGVSSAEQMLQEINQRLDSAESTLGESGGSISSSQIPFRPLPGFYDQLRQMPIGQPLNNSRTAGLASITNYTPFAGETFNQVPEQFRAGFDEYTKENPIGIGGQAMTPVGLPDGNRVMFSNTASAGAFSDYLNSIGQGVSPVGTATAIQSPIANAMRPFADGGRADDDEDYVGGIMDLESARQMYGLGKLVKKVTRGIKKIAKSPVGKIALLAGGAGLLSKGGFGLPSFLSKKGLSDFFFAGKPMALKNLTQRGLLTGIGGLSAFAGLMTPKEEEDEDTYLGPTLDIAGIRQNPYAAMGETYRFAADGGLMRQNYAEGSKEPVAKKTMPLLDMDGMEKDYRADGGFVPIGRMERADDVPARLSKNEFVFTADAVRNAGDGDVDKGAEVMYNMMKNLEAGGNVSEESQGLDGARKMFQTSQRLEEVL